ncbi:MAG TPA: metallophosphoesterase [Pseudolabrys sp.]|uniref:metallophosphoesterase family protein n=1 Tax=Pseudolabrys sp. TaxID=1960880 RepID=UPI002DDCF3D5|nr:metallophosphoesterase [Pseudolabrys sp.]HEV2627455.1 metallophosphoesterase [Pseudolabrys sp.]
MFTLAHLSDLHLSPLPRPRLSELMNKRITGYINWLRKRRFLHDRAVLETLIEDLKDQAPDHIAITGDIANIALEEEFVRGRNWLQHLDSFKSVSFVPGNHDAYVRHAVRYAPQWAPWMTGDDGLVGFPYVRRRGPIALIGLSTAIATPPFMATGRLGEAQIKALGPLLDKLKTEGLFRVILIHHPPVTKAAEHKRLLDAWALVETIAAHGAELLLHGHDHLHMLNWLKGPAGTRVPAVGVPSASAAPGLSHDAAAYNLYRVDGAPGAWRCEMVSRGFADGGRIVESTPVSLSASS